MWPTDAIKPFIAMAEVRHTLDEHLLLESPRLVPVRFFRHGDSFSLRSRHLPHGHSPCPSQERMQS